MAFTLIDTKSMEQFRKEGEDCVRSFKEIKEEFEKYNRELLVRLFLNDSVFPETLTQDEKAIYKAITCKTYFNPTTTNEAQHIQEATNALKPLPKPTMPMFLFVSNGTDTGVEKETWQKYPRDYASEQSNVVMKELDCGHMLNREMPEQISADMKDFIEGLG